MRHRTPRAPAWPFAVLVAMVIGSTACGSAGKDLKAPPVPGAGSIAGRYIEQDAAGRDSVGVAGVTVGAFQEEFDPGALVHNPPSALVTARTGSDGSFRITGLSPGRYFVVPVDARAVTAGRWVRLTEDRGAALLLIGCTDCPPRA